MFCFNFNFTTFSLIFFPLFSKVFTNIVKIYKLPKIYNKIPMPQMHQAFKLYPSYLYWICTLKTLLALNFKKTRVGLFLKTQCQKSPFLLHQILSLFSTINFAYIKGINIFERDYSNLRYLKKRNGIASSSI